MKKLFIFGFIFGLVLSSSLSSLAKTTERGKSHLVTGNDRITVLVNKAVNG